MRSLSAATDTLKWNAATGALAYKVQVSLDPTFAKKALLAVECHGDRHQLCLFPRRRHEVLLAHRGGQCRLHKRVYCREQLHDSRQCSNDRSDAGCTAQQGNEPARSYCRSRSAERPMHHGISGRCRTCRRSPCCLPMKSRRTRPTPGRSPAVQTFYWRVRGVNDLGATAYSSIDTFTRHGPAGQNDTRLPGEQCDQRRVG